MHFIKLIFIYFIFLAIAKNQVIGQNNENILNSNLDQNDSAFLRKKNDDNINTSSSQSQDLLANKEGKNTDKRLFANKPEENNNFSGFQLLPTSANRSTFRCPEKFGYFADGKDCTKYFVCVFGEPLHESCTGGLYFSAELQTCDWPRNVLCHNADGSVTLIGNSNDLTDKKNPELNGGSFFSTVDDDDESNDKNGYKATSVHSDLSDQHTTPNSLSNNLNSDYIGIPFKNVSNEQGTNRNYLDSSAEKQNDELLSRSIDGDVIRNSVNNLQKQNSRTNDENISRESSRTTVSGSETLEYNTESSINEKPTDSSIFYENNSKNDLNKKLDKSNSNKINLEFEPQPPNYAEAIPSVVDSKGGIHYSDGFGGTFGIVDELPGVLSSNEGNSKPSRNEHHNNLNIFVKSLKNNINSPSKAQNNPYDVFNSNVNSQLDKDLALLERRSRKLFGEEQNTRKNTNSKNDNSNNKNKNLHPDNNHNGYQYVPVITPEKLLFQTTRNPFDFQTSTQRHKNTGLSRSSASRPRGRVIYADFDEEDRSNLPKNDADNIKDNGPSEAEVEALIRNSLNLNNPQEIVNHSNTHRNNNNNQTFDHSSNSGNVQPHFLNNLGNHHTNNFNKNNNNQPVFHSNAEIIVVPIHRASNNANQNNNARAKPNQNNQLPSNSNTNQHSNRLRNNVHIQSHKNNLSIRHPRLEPGVLAPGSNGFIGVIFDDEDTATISPITSSQSDIISGPSPTILDLPQERNANPRNRPKQNNRVVLNGENQELKNNHHQSSHVLHHSQHQQPNSVQHHPNNNIQSTTPLTTAVAVAHNPDANILRKNQLSKPDWSPTDNYGNRDKKFNANYDTSAFENERNTLPPTIKPSRNTNRQRQNGNQRQRNHSSANIISTSTTTSSTTTTESSTTKWQPTSTPKPSRNSNSLSNQSNSNNRRKTNKKLVIKPKNILASPPQLASRPPAIYESPIPGSQAKKCDRSVCKIPDCNCGGPQIPGGLKEKEVPQLVLLTFDDAVNDLNWEIYEEIFNSGRKNPNGCPLVGTFYVSHEWTDYGQVQTLHSRGHEIASHGVTHSFGEKFSKTQWLKEVNGQREILHLYGGVPLHEIRGMRAPFLQIGGNKMFEMLHEANFTYDSSMPVFDNKPPFWPYTLDYAINHECMITPCPTKSYPGLWEVGMVMWEDLRGGRCSMGDACSNPSTEEDVYEMLMKNFNRHYKTNRAPFGLFYHSAWFNTVHHRRGFIKFLDKILNEPDVYLTTNWQMIQWMRDPTPINQLKNFEPFRCDNLSNLSSDGRFKFSQCNHANVCNVRHKSGGSRFMKTCQPCPQQYPWVGNTGFPKSIYG